MVVAAAAVSRWSVPRPTSRTGQSTSRFRAVLRFTAASGIRVVVDELSRDEKSIACATVCACGCASELGCRRNSAWRAKKRLALRNTDGNIVGAGRGGASSSQVGRHLASPLWFCFVLFFCFFLDTAGPPAAERSIRWTKSTFRMNLRSHSWNFVPAPLW